MTVLYWNWISLKRERATVHPGRHFFSGRHFKTETSVNYLHRNKCFVSFLIHPQGWENYPNFHLRLFKNLVYLYIECKLLQSTLQMQNQTTPVIISVTSKWKFKNWWYWEVYQPNDHLTRLTNGNNKDNPMNRSIFKNKNVILTWILIIFWTNYLVNSRFSLFHSLNFKR